MDLKLEAIVIPVSDVNRAKAFYETALGFRVDVDHPAARFEDGRGFRRPASSARYPHRADDAARIGLLHPEIGEGLNDVKPGTYQNTYLVTSDLEATLVQLVARGVDVSEPFHFDLQGQSPGLDPERRSYNSFATFSDPDGNGWLLQEIQVRAPGR